MYWHRICCNSRWMKTEAVMENNKVLVNHLEETINSICDRVRNKMVAPYAALQSINNERAKEELVEMGLEDIRWLCYVYIPSILTEVHKKVEHLV